MPSYSSPNRMVWQYFEALRRAVARSHAEQDPHKRQQEIAVTVFLAVTTVEAFLNLFFRVLVDEDGYRRHKPRLLNDLSRRISLDQKWKEWPEVFFGRAVDMTDGPGKRFLALKSLRNRLMHFTSTHDTIDLPGNVRIEGLSDTSVLDNLSAADADLALSAVEDAIAVVLEAKGVPKTAIPGNVHLWTGKVPI